MKQVVAEFAQELLTFLDENASPKELNAFSTLCRRTRACVLSGDPLDTPFIALQDKANALFRESRERDFSLAEVERSLRTLEDITRIKATAYSARKNGAIQTATLFECQVERSYRTLPVEFRW